MTSRGEFERLAKWTLKYLTANLHPGRVERPGAK